MARQIKRLKSGQSGKEWKTHDILVSETVTSTGSVTPLTLIAQGATSLTREGLRIKLQSMQIKGKLEGNAASSVSHCWFRCIVVQDNEQHGTVAGLTDYLESADDIAFIEHDKRQRWKTILDKHMDLSNYALNDTSTLIPRRRSYKFYKKWKTPKNLTFLGVAATQASQGRGNLYLIMISSQAANGPVIELNFRFRFTE